VNELELLSLVAGDVGTIASVRRLGPGTKRLADLGFVRGARLEMVRPGEPCIVRIEGTQVAISGGYQASIELVSAPPDSC